MPDEQITEQSCNPNCPNRRRDGITLVFGKNQRIHLDPFEILLWVLIVSLPTGITLRDAWDKKLEFNESLTRIAMISAMGCLIRLSPTEQVSIFLQNFQILGGKKEREE
jgi:hypothetical protein